MFPLHSKLGLLRMFSLHSNLSLPHIFSPHSQLSLPHMFPRTPTLVCPAQLPIAMLTFTPRSVSGNIPGAPRVKFIGLMAIFYK